MGDKDITKKTATKSKDPHLLQRAVLCHGATESVAGQGPGRAVTRSEQVPPRHCNLVALTPGAWHSLARPSIAPRRPRVRLPETKTDAAGPRIIDSFDGTWPKQGGFPSDQPWAGNSATGKLPGRIPPLDKYPRPWVDRWTDR